MTDRERELTRKLYDLTLVLWEHQGEEIEALRRANQALQKSHDTIGEMLQIVGELVRVN